MTLQSNNQTRHIHKPEGVQNLRLVDFASGLVASLKEARNIYTKIVTSDKEGDYLIVRAKTAYHLGYLLDEVEALSDILADGLGVVNDDEILYSLSTNTVPLSELKKAVSTALYWQKKYREASEDARALQVAFEASSATDTDLLKSFMNRLNSKK